MAAEQAANTTLTFHHLVKLFWQKHCETVAKLHDQRTRAVNAATLSLILCCVSMHLVFNCWMFQLLVTNFICPLLDAGPVAHSDCSGLFFQGFFLLTAAWHKTKTMNWKTLKCSIELRGSAGDKELGEKHHYVDSYDFFFVGFPLLTSPSVNSRCNPALAVRDGCCFPAGSLQKSRHDWLTGSCWSFHINSKLFSHISCQRNYLLPLCCCCLL